MVASFNDEYDTDDMIWRCQSSPFEWLELENDAGNTQLEINMRA